MKHDRKPDNKKSRTKPEFREFAATGKTVMGSAFEDRSALATPRNIARWRGLLRDGQIAPTWQQRQLAMLAVEWEVFPASEDAGDVAAADFIREQLGRVGFDDLCRKMHYGNFFGFAVGECLWAKDGKQIVLDKIRVRQPERFEFNQKGELLFKGGDNPSGVPLPENKMWVYCVPGDNDDVPHGPPLGWQLYWPWFLKENGAKFWAVAQEKFGMPTVLGKYPAGSKEEDIETLLKSLNAVHAQGAIAVPEGFLIELLSVMRSTGGDNEVFQKYWDDAISKIILSQTMTTDNGSSKSQAQVHKSVRDEVVQADADLLCASFNTGPLLWLSQWNFPGARPPQVWRRIAQKEDLFKRALRDKAIMETSGLRPTKESIQEAYGGEWEPVPAQTRTQTPARPATTADFAAFDPERDEIDDLTDQLEELTLESYDDLLNDLKSRIEKAKSLEEVESLLADFAAGTRHKTETAELLSQALMTADLAGRASIEEDGDDEKG